MKRWNQAMVILGAMGLAGVVVPRLFWFKRRSFQNAREMERLALERDQELALTHLRAGHPHLIITAHGFMKSMNDHQMVKLADRLSERFDVLTFDFPGHGLSAGWGTLDFQRSAEALTRVIAHARTLGYARVGVIGYSMGAAAAILAAAEGAPIDAVVSVSCPALPPRGMRRHRQRIMTWGWRWWARCMGTRVAPVMQPGPWPIERVDRVAPIPLLIVHSELDTLVRREDSEALFAVAKYPKDYLFLPGALHAWPMASVDPVIAWLEARLTQPAEASTGR